MLNRWGGEGRGDSGAMLGSGKERPESVGDQAFELGREESVEKEGERELFETGNPSGGLFLREIGLQG